MSTMTLPAAPQAKFTGFGHLARSFALLVEVFAEAQQLATDAHRKFPFGRW